MTEIDTLRNNAFNTLEAWNDHVEELQLVQAEVGKRFRAARKAQNTLDQYIIDNLDPDLGWLMKVGWLEDDSPRYKELLRRYPQQSEFTICGYDPDLGQRCFQITMPFRASDKLRDNIAAKIAEVRPHLKPHEDGYKYFSIFEKTLSEWGVYQLRMKRTTVQVVRISGSRVDVMCTGSMKKCLKAMALSWWYGKEEN